MKDQAVNKLMEKALDYLQSAEAFAQKEVPAYVEELLNFKVFEHLVNYFDDFLITVPIFTVGVLLCYSLYKEYKKKKDEEFIHIGLFLMCLLSLPLMVSVFITHDLVQAYKAYSAPRVYLVDYFKGELK